MTDSSQRLQAIIEDADRCVKCAVCLPHCPTYGISGNEAESPRGRIALMRSLADGSQPLSAGMEKHLDQCLTCRSCEPVCPAGVRYGRLLDNARAEQARRRPPGWRKRAGLALLSRRRLLRGLAVLARAARSFGLGRILPGIDRLPRRFGPGRWPAGPAPTDTAGRNLGLFIGCVADVVDAETRDAAWRLLTACGHRVALPAAQTCCGALHRHGGLDGKAGQLAERNRRAFEAAGVETVVSTATGCGAHLEEHVFPGAHADICEWLAREPALEGLSFTPLAARVAVQLPCTQRNVLRDTGSTTRLLQAIPGLQVEAVPADPKCCGAAGTYMLEHPAIADELGSTQARAIARLDPDFLVTANVGCGLHLGDHLRRLGCRTEVLHPVTLLARQLRQDGHELRNL